MGQAERNTTGKMESRIERWQKKNQKCGVHEAGDTKRAKARTNDKNMVQLGAKGGANRWAKGIRKKEGNVQGRVKAKGNLNKGENLKEFDRRTSGGGREMNLWIRG